MYYLFEKVNIDLTYTYSSNYYLQVMKHTYLFLLCLIWLLGDVLGGEEWGCS
jgi:hypothetical protein